MTISLKSRLKKIETHMAREKRPMEFREFSDVELAARCASVLCSPDPAMKPVADKLRPLLQAMEKRRDQAIAQGEGSDQEIRHQH